MTLTLTLQHRFDDFELDLDVIAGDGVTAIFGPSGSGKTTIIRAVAGLLRPDAGRIQMGDRVLFDHNARTHIKPSDRRIGYVFQEPRLFPHMTVSGNLTYAKGAKASFDDVVQMLGIDQLLDRRPANLSGGEAQRVAIGRALLSEPDMLLMDEPLASLDQARKDDILPYLEQLRDYGQVPILYVSHDMGEVARLAGHIILLNRGRAVHSGPTADVLADPKTMALIGPRHAGAILTARLVGYEPRDGLCLFETSAGRLVLPGNPGQVGETRRIRVLAQDIVLAKTKPTDISALNVLPVSISSMTAGHGPGVAVGLVSGTDALLARITKRSAQVMRLEPGQQIYAILKATAVAPSDISAH